MGHLTNNGGNLDDKRKAPVVQLKTTDEALTRYNTYKESTRHLRTSTYISESPEKAEAKVRNNIIQKNNMDKEKQTAFNEILQNLSNSVASCHDYVNTIEGKVDNLWLSPQETSSGGTKAESEKEPRNFFENLVLLHRKIDALQNRLQTVAGQLCNII